MSAQAIAGFIQNAAPLMKSLEGGLGALSDSGAATGDLATLLKGAESFAGLASLLGEGDVGAVVGTVIEGVAANPELIGMALKALGKSTANPQVTFANAHTPESPQVARPKVQLRLAKNDRSVNAARVNGTLAQGALAGDLVQGLAYFGKYAGNGGYRLPSAQPRTQATAVQGFAKGMANVTEQVLELGSQDPNSAMARLPKPASFEDLLSAFMIDQVIDQQEEVREKMAALEAMNAKIDAASAKKSVDAKASQETSIETPATSAALEVPQLVDTSTAATSGSSNKETVNHANTQLGDGLTLDGRYSKEDNAKISELARKGDFSGMAKLQNEIKEKDSAALAELKANNPEGHAALVEYRSSSKAQRAAVREAKREENEGWLESAWTGTRDFFVDSFDQLKKGETTGLLKLAAVVSLIGPFGPILGAGIAVGALLFGKEGEKAGGKATNQVPGAPSAAEAGATAPGAGAAPGKGAAPEAGGAVDSDTGTGGKESLERSRTLLFEQMKQSVNRMQEMQTALSNILKAFHDTAMSSVRNIK